jgi:hypothetical protein
MAADSEETRSGDVETEDDLDDDVQLAPRAAPHRSSRCAFCRPPHAESDSNHVSNHQPRAHIMYTVVVEVQ